MKNFIVCAVACLALAGACFAEPDTTRGFLQTRDVTSCKDSVKMIVTDARMLITLNEGVIEAIGAIIQVYIKCIPQEGLGACNSLLITEMKELWNDFLLVNKVQLQKIADDVRNALRYCFSNILLKFAALLAY